MSKVQVNWFEIPVHDVSKAAAFYGKVLGCSFKELEGPAGPMRAFLNGDDMVGCLVQGDHLNPGGQGIALYLDAVGDIDGCLSRAEANGGKVALPKTSIGEHGAIAQILDPDGNSVGLHSL
ncbi:MAG: VOC family protein [Kiloniellales bacterium]